MSLLRVMLAEALNQQDRNLAAQLYETIRSVSNLDEVGCCLIPESRDRWSIGESIDILTQVSRLCDIQTDIVRYGQKELLGISDP